MSTLNPSTDGSAPAWAHGEPYGVDMLRILAAYVEAHPEPIEQLTVEDARRRPTLADAASVVARRELDPVAALGVLAHDLTIPGPQGRLPVRVYTPQPTPTEPCAIVVYWHGGGWVLGDLETHDTTPRTIAKLAKCLVVSCGYRLAPEHRFPAAHDDALAAYVWVLSHADSLGGDPDRMATMGECSGGNLACAVPMMARDRGLRLPRHMVLVYPIAARPSQTPSRRAHPRARPIGAATVDWFLAQAYGRSPASKDPRLDLLDADLRGLPPTIVVTAEIDPLRSDGELLATHLQQQGVEVRHRCFRGVPHEFFGLGLFVKEAAIAETWVARELRRTLGTVVYPR